MAGLLNPRRDHPRQLGQLRPANTTAASLYSPGTGVTTRVELIVVCNQSGSSAKYRIFMDDNGTTYDQTTALFYDILLGADQSDSIEGSYFMDDVDGNLAVRTDTNNALTFTCFGRELT